MLSHCTLERATRDCSADDPSKVAAADSLAKEAAALGTRVYFARSVFGAAGTTAADALGEIDDTDPMRPFGDIFEHALSQLDQLGRLGAGRSSEDYGDDYSFLPGQHSFDGDCPPDNDIACSTTRAACWLRN